MTSSIARTEIDRWIFGLFMYIQTCDLGIRFHSSTTQKPQSSENSELQITDNQLQLQFIKTHVRRMG